MILFRKKTYKTPPNVCSAGRAHERPLRQATSKQAFRSSTERSPTAYGGNSRPKDINLKKYVIALTTV